MITSIHARVFFALLQRDIKVLLMTLKDNCIDSSIIIIFTYIVYGHFLPLMGMSTAMIAPIFLGIIILVAINIMYDRALRDSIDLSYIRYIDYQICLPINRKWLCAKYIFSYIIDLYIATIPIFVLGYFVFYHYLNFSQGNIFLFLGISLLCAAVISTGFLIEVFGVSVHWFRENTFARILMPMILMGSIYYPWKSAYAVSPFIGKLLLLSPLTYMVEGLRSSIIGTDAFISLSISTAVLLSLLVINIILLYYLMNKRLSNL